jgi:uncharacterized SAM-binding protein YcdF (DUF218 family)
MERLFSYGFLALPTVFISLALVGALIALRWWRAGLALAIAASFCLFAAATPLLSSVLLCWAEAGLPAAPDLSAAQAIVVLGGDVKLGDGRDIPDTLGTVSLERVVFAAAAYRRLHVPIVVSGGSEPGEHTSAAALMKAVLDGDFGVPVKWVEDRSRTTWENALYTTALMRPAGISRVVLINEAWAMPRALWAFERLGMIPMAWPAPTTVIHPLRITDFLPNSGALRDSFYALHELVGDVYYRWRY